MMPLPSQFHTVDTLQVRPAAEAFTSGSLVIPLPGEAAQAAVPGWGNYPVNYLLVILSILFFLLSLGRLVNIFPTLIRSLSRGKEVLNLEDSMGLLRDRNSMALVLIVPFCLVASRYPLYTPAFLGWLPPGWRTVGIIGVFLLYLLLRWILVRTVPHRGVNNDSWMIAYRSADNYFILAVLLLTGLCGLLSLLGVEDLTIRTVAYYILGLSYLLFVLRRTQILAYSCNHFKAFLYLCALEILPAALLVVSGVLL